jgi:hypothetical protein
MKVLLRTLALSIAAVAITNAQRPMPWDLPPLRYSETEAADAISRFSASDLEAFRGKPPLVQLALLLERLGISPDSQVLVFSKTSAQNPLIGPRSPRAIYFNENAYVGYVPGGHIEAIIQDPKLGSVFHLIEPATADTSIRIGRDTSECMACHGTNRTAHVPGPFVRSVHPDEEGRPLLSLGTTDVDGATPIAERWGGYYVTGRSSLQHFGNQTFSDEHGRDFPRRRIELDSVVDAVPAATDRYLRTTSDVVALMVLEHQCGIHNQLNAAALRYQHARWLALLFDPSCDPDEGNAGTAAKESARELADALLFKDEAPLGNDGIEGAPAFQIAFESRFPRSRDGRSLADLQLSSRLFKHRCSYMVYSPAFKSLPETLRREILARLDERLDDGPEAAPWIPATERARIRTILEETMAR